MNQKTKQSRKYQVTINNPAEHGLTREIILEKCNKLCPDYFCLCEEVGESGTHHIHIFIYRSSPIRFRTIKKAFPTAHIEQTYGTIPENRDYILKGGKWEESAKASTSIPGTFAEFGDIPTETKSSSSEGTTMEDLLDAVQEGKSTARIIQQNPKFAFRVKDIDAVRQTLLAEQFMEQNRNVKVAYLYGAPGAGKTRGIFAKHGAKNICHVTNYRQGKGVSFDAYYGQDVLVFEEFAGQIPIEEMLNYLDVYPLMLPARYADRVACFTQVYITSNLPLEQQYPAIQRERPATWEAFLRRIQTVVHYESDNKVTEMTMQQWKEHNYDFMKQTEIRKETAHRSAFLRFGNGVDRIVHTPSEWVGFIAYLLLIIYIGFAIKANVTMMPSIATTAMQSLYILAAAIGTVAFVIWRGTPRHARRIENSLARIGLTNSAGEVPLLIESHENTTLSKIRAVTVLEFLACGIEQNEWEKRKTAIEAALNVQIAKIEECDGKQHIRLYIVPATQGLPEHLDWRDTMMDYTYPACKVVLGENLLEPMVIDLNIYPHLLIGGGTGSGKTVLLKLILMQLLMKNCVKVTVADFKGGIDFGNVWTKHTNCRMIFTRDELSNYLDTLVDELHRRKEIIAATEGCNNIYEYNNRCAQYMDRIVLAIDEVAEILDKSGLDKTEKEQAVQIERRIATIARLGRAVGIHLILATQRPDANILSGQIKNNISYRVCGRADNVLSTIILDNTSAADEIPSDARGRFIDNEGTVFQSYWFNESAIDWRTAQT